MLLSFTLPILLTGYVWSTQNTSDNYCLNDTGDAIFLNKTANLIFVLTLSVYIIVALYSCVFGLRRLQRPGVSGEVRKKFLSKHFSYVITFIVIWTVQSSAYYYHLFDESDNEVVASVEQNKRVNTISGVMIFSTGIFLSIVRLSEPFFRFLVIQELY